MKHVIDWTTEDERSVVAALEAGVAVCRSNPLFEVDSPDRVRYAIFSGEVQAVLVDNYLVVYDVGSSIYSFKPVLFELLIVATKPGGDVRNAISALSLLAKEHNCALVVAGNSTGRAGLSELYKRAGFNKASETLLRKVE